MRSAEVIGASPGAVGTWVKVLLYCGEQENGGRIEGAGRWKDVQWQRACGVKAKEVMAAAPLLLWDGEALVVWGYPADQQRAVVAKREIAKQNGRRGGRPPRQEPTLVPVSETDVGSSSVSGLESVMYSKVRKGNVCVEGSDAHTHTDFYSLESLAAQFPHVDLKDELRKAGQWCQRKNGSGGVDLKWFGEWWLPRCGHVLGKVEIAAASPSRSDAEEPDGWQAWLDEKQPGTPYAKGGEKYGTPWREVDGDLKVYIVRALKETHAA